MTHSTQGAQALFSCTDIFSLRITISDLDDLAQLGLSEIIALTDSALTELSASTNSCVPPSVENRLRAINATAAKYKRHIAFQAVDDRIDDPQDLEQDPETEGATVVESVSVGGAG